MLLRKTYLLALGTVACQHVRTGPPGLPALPSPPTMRAPAIARTVPCSKLIFTAADNRHEAKERTLVCIGYGASFPISDRRDIGT
jgi:hypothetical protein